MQWLALILILPYIIIIFLIYREVTKIKPFCYTLNPAISVSVVIACRNEEKNLPSLLNKISKQNYPTDLLEIIIVDDNSSDSTFATAEKFLNDKKVLVLKNTGSGKKQAIRTGIKRASGKLIISTDADCLMGAEWVATIAAFYEKNNPDFIVCPVRIQSDDTFSGKLQAIEFLSLQGITAGTAIAGKSTMCNGANLAFSKQTYQEHSDKLHDEIGSGDDIFLLQSIKKAKGKIMWLESPDAIVTTFPAATARAFFSQRKRWISKSSSYTDTFTIALAIVTFVTILTQILLLAASFFSIQWFQVFIVAFILKSLPDYLIIRETARRYDEKELLNWFIPAQIIYPFYVFIVVCLSVSGKKKENL
jgi:biofilm PGA synthesis N-glycosyltransferase PgaC